ncbi:MAG: Fungal specific transcription factor [Candelina submexicana]|nr:MAG: Fungal specific transcription factor [Candelina submexicana]
MNPTSPTSVAGGTKRPRQSPDDPFAPPPLTTSTSVSSASSSSFRNVSACNRCRLRKNRCDQHLPACASCEKSHTKCVGYDPITKKEIPRSYVYYLETRVSYLESLLEKSDIPFAVPEAFDTTSKARSENAVQTPTNETSTAYSAGDTAASVHVDDAVTRREGDQQGTAWARKQNEAEKLNKLVSNIGMVSVQGASDPRYLGSTSGISFARVVFAAVRSSVSSTSSERNGVRPSKPITSGIAAATDGTSMRDSFFGLHTKPAIKQAPFPSQELGLKLVELYFEHANPQIPILHRGEFMVLFNRVFTIDEGHRSARELYMLNIVFAIGAGIIWGDSDSAESRRSPQSPSPTERSPHLPSSKRQRLSSQQYQPEEYHASAIIHLESFLGTSPAADRPDGFGGGLEELQAVLLLAGFALLRPVAPGLWYIVGVAVRLGVDLGLHHEDGLGIEGSTGGDAGTVKSEDIGMTSIDGSGSGIGGKDIGLRERGRREWVRDLRRRLWWCIYSFDRLVSTCVGRPFGISDQVVTTEFPSLLEDSCITTAGFLATPHDSGKPSYKHVAHHYFKLRLLQSEILQVLQYQQAQQARASVANRGNHFIHTNLPSPFLHNFNSFRSWREDVDRRLWEWKESAPTKKQTGVQFSLEFLELNYWQAIIMLYRQSLSVPPMFAGEKSPTDEVNSPISTIEEHEDEESVFLKVAEAGQRVLRLYRQLHRVHLVNYTFLATHHLFMAGISFLYAIWHSSLVRSHLSMDDVDFTILAATSVLGDLIEKCPPAEACRDAFNRMSKATVQMCLSTTGFGNQSSGLHTRKTALTPQSSNGIGKGKLEEASPSVGCSRLGFPPQDLGKPDRYHRPIPSFDMNMRDLFPQTMSSSKTITRTVSSDSQSNRMGAIRPKQDPITCMPSSQAQGQTSHGFSIGENQNLSVDPTIDPSLSQQQFPILAQPTYPDLGLQNLEFADNTGGPFDLGFGFELDYDHDWSDGPQYDIFEGFFFGGSGASAKYGLPFLSTLASLTDHVSLFCCSRDQQVMAVFYHPRHQYLCSIECVFPLPSLIIVILLSIISSSVASPSSSISISPSTAHRALISDSHPASLTIDPLCRKVGVLDGGLGFWSTVILCEKDSECPSPRCKCIGKFDTYYADAARIHIMYGYRAEGLGTSDGHGIGICGPSSFMSSSTGNPWVIGRSLPPAPAMRPALSRGSLIGRRDTSPPSISTSQTNPQPPTESAPKSVSPSQPAAPQNLITSPRAVRISRPSTVPLECMNELILPGSGSRILRPVSCYDDEDCVRERRGNPVKCQCNGGYDEDFGGFIRFGYGIVLGYDAHPYPYGVGLCGAIITRGRPIG